MGTTSSPAAADQIRLRVVFVAVALGLMTMSFTLAKTARDALYFQGRGVYNLPFAYVAIAAISLPLAGFVLWLMRTLGPRRARIAVPLGAAVVLAGFAHFVHPGSGAPMTALFLYVPLVFGVLFSLS